MKRLTVALILVAACLAGCVVGCVAFEAIEAIHYPLHSHSSTTLKAN